MLPWRHPQTRGQREAPDTTTNLLSHLRITLLFARGSFTVSAQDVDMSVCIAEKDDSTDSRLVIAGWPSAD